MVDIISHTGVVEQIEGRHVVVRIVQEAGCSSCKIAGHCTMSESKEKRIDVYDTDTSVYKVGDGVTVYIDARTGFRTVGLAFGLPLVIMLAAILGVHFFIGN